MINKSKTKVSVFILGLMLAVGQGFAKNCAADYVAPENLVWNGTSTEEPCTIDGSYIIDNANKLAWYAKNYNKGDAKLTADIDLGGKLWTPIAAGTGDKKYAKIFDGNNHTVKNLYINGTELAAIDIKNAQNLGFVGSLGGGTIKNLVLVVSEIYGSTNAGETTIKKPISVGTLVGWISSGTVTNCVVEGSITTSGKDNRVGGLVGNAWNATISDCVSMVSISASGQGTHVGGIVGALRSDGDKTSTVHLSSCVFDGDTLISLGGSVGGIVGNYDKSNVETQENLYFTGNYSGVGNGPSIVTIQEDNLNSEETVCKLNKGEWNTEAKTCSGTSNEIWSEGQSSISLNGSDGYKVSFNANGGTFASGAKTFKIVANGATITADEITEPTRTNPKNMKFAGWATTANAEKPTELGVADSNKTLYAVWYDFYTVTFKLADTVSYSISVPKHGHVSMEGFTVPSSYKEPDAESEGDSIKYYFTGWGPEAKWLGFYIDPSTGDTVKIDPTPDDTLHLASIDVLRDTTLYPVWTRAETYSVTFDATLHGKTHVRFVKKVNQGDAVEEPDDVVTNPGYKIIGWCTNENTAECSEYDFDAPLTKNLTLYAEWDTVSYTITYEMNGGTNDGSNPSAYTVQSDTITFAEPTYPGYDFKGWFYDEGFTQPATGIATNTMTGNKTLYAKWTPIEYTIEYLSGNEVSGTIVADKKAWGQEIELKGVEFALQRDGYIHDGWSLTAEGSLDYQFGAKYSANKDLILYPHWVEGAPEVVHYGAISIYTYADHVDAEINGEYTGEDEYSLDEDITVNSVVLNRSFVPYVPVTLTLPFDIAVENVENAKFYVFGGISVGENGKKAVEANRVKEGTLAANTPYMVVPTGTSILFNGSVTFRETVDPVTTVGTWQFCGTYSYKTVAAENVNSVYGISGSADGDIPQGSFVKFKAGSWFVPMRAYLLNTEVSNRRLARAYSAASVNNSRFEIIWNEGDEETVDEQTTSVRKPVVSSKIVNMRRVYDLKGRQVNGETKVKGAYYNKKVVK